MVARRHLSLSALHATWFFPVQQFCVFTRENTRTFVMRRVEKRTILLDAVRYVERITLLLEAMRRVEKSDSYKLTETHVIYKTYSRQDEMRGDDYDSTPCDEKRAAENDSSSGCDVSSKDSKPKGLCRHPADSVQLYKCKRCIKLVTCREDVPEHLVQNHWRSPSRLWSLWTATRDGL